LAYFPIDRGPKKKRKSVNYLSPLRPLRSIDKRQVQGIGVRIGAFQVLDPSPDRVKELTLTLLKRGQRDRIGRNFNPSSLVTGKSKEGNAKKRCEN